MGILPLRFPDCFMIIIPLQDVVGHRSFIARINIAEPENGLVMPGGNGIQFAFHLIPVVHTTVFHHMIKKHVREFQRDHIRVVLTGILPVNHAGHGLYISDQIIREKISKILRMKRPHYQGHHCHDHQAAKLTHPYIHIVPPV